MSERLRHRAGTRARAGIITVAVAGCLFAPGSTRSSRLSAQARTEVGTFQVTSGLGRKLYALPDDDALASARKKLAADPKNASLALALSQAEAGRRQYREAIATCTKALGFAPTDADLYIERGHRELGLREFQRAERDLAHAAALDTRRNSMPSTISAWRTISRANSALPRLRFEKRSPWRKPTTASSTARIGSACRCAAPANPPQPPKRSPASLRA